MEKCYHYGHGLCRISGYLKQSLTPHIDPADDPDFAEVYLIR
ncbi:hypothetical protein B857_03718 [Solibacillus isronensis B3W22]|uniref:Uncharacterized protein n=1 Tax=Solibacillus isronensis B3W22 TaxID=1224748 RepID=K1KLV1_9BACL|nr:hypothetical protein B857_03718 [Solibacillus isronensis B3W22]